MRQGSAEDFRWEVAAFCSAERALGDDPGIGEGEDGRRDVFVTRFAANGEVAGARGGQVEH